MISVVLAGCISAYEKNTENCEVSQDSCKNLCSDYQTEKDGCLTRCDNDYYICRSDK